MCFARMSLTCECATLRFNRYIAFTLSLSFYYSLTVTKRLENMREIQYFKFIFCQTLISLSGVDDL